MFKNTLTYLIIALGSGIVSLMVTEVTMVSIITAGLAILFLVFFLISYIKNSFQKLEP
ncbi:hypothetical protein MTsPCn5_06490 [Croceitalea sp. MTPC5]|nr:hypothetical protein MTsPCn5_06490 [Croceitalea sp. MTPC5]